MMSLGRPFWRLYASSATSNLADGIGRTALPLLAASYTRSPVAVAGLFTFAFLPWLLFALPSGALVDRVDRRHAMSAANALRAVSMGTLAVLVFAHAGNVVLLYAVSFALGIAETVYDSATRALLPQVVSADRLDTANSLLTVEETLGQTFLGAPVGSALFALAAAVPIVLNAGGFVIAALLVLTLRGDYRAARAEEPTSIRHDIADGVRWLVSHRFLRDLTLISAATACVQTMASGLLVLYVLEVLRLPSGDFGYVLIAAGAGALIGGISTPRLAQRFGRPVMLTVGSFVAAVPMGLMAFTRNGFVGSALFAIAGAGVMVWNVLTMSLRQSLIPHELFGRVQGAYRTLVWGAMPLGALAGGALASAFGIRAVFAIVGAGLFVLAAVLGVIVRIHRDALAADPVAIVQSREVLEVSA
jgi:Na+/melibiose symporter-like transporter